MSCSRCKQQFRRSKISSTDASWYMVSWKHHYVIFPGQGMSKLVKLLGKQLMVRWKSFQKRWSPCWHSCNLLSRLHRYYPRLVRLLVVIVISFCLCTANRWINWNTSRYTGFSWHAECYHSIAVYLLIIAFIIWLLVQVEELVVKEKDLEERLMVKHSTVVDCYEKKYGGREIESRVASHLQKITALRQEVDDLLEFIDEI